MPRCAVWLCIPLSTLVSSLLCCLQLPFWPAGQGPPPPKTEVPNGLMRRWFQTGDTFTGGPETEKTLELHIWHVVPLTLTIGSQPQGKSPGSHSMKTQFKTKMLKLSHPAPGSHGRALLFADDCIGEGNFRKIWCSTLAQRSPQNCSFVGIVSTLLPTFGKACFSEKQQP